MSYYLFLDDSREPSHVNWVTLPENVDWKHARSYYEFVGMVGELGIPKFIAYDCDLCGEHYAAYYELKDTYGLHYKEFKTKCGIHCAEYLMAMCKKAGVKHPPYVIHSQNTFAKAFLKNLIENFNKE